MLCFSLHAMQTPPRPAAAGSKELESCVYTPTSNKVRINLLSAITTAIEGDGCDESFDQEQLAPNFLHASPSTFVKKVRKAYNAMLAEEFTEAGVTPEMIATHKSPVKVDIKVMADATDRLLSPASSPIKKAAHEMASRLGEHLTFHRGETGIEAYQNDDLAVVDEALLKDIASSPESLKFVAGHEIGHKRNRDQVVRAALLRALVPLSPSAEREKIKNKKCRAQEVFADLTPAALSPTLAKASVRVMEKIIANEGAGTIGEYPLNTQRRDVVHATQAFHEQHQKEKQRAVRRSLMDELEQTEMSSIGEKLAQ